MSRKYFYNLMQGKFLEKNTPGELQTETQEVKGHLVNITFNPTKYGEAMRLHLVDECNFYIISMFVRSRTATAFFLICKNLVLQHEMNFKVKSIDGKDYLTVEQFGGPVMWSDTPAPGTNEERIKFYKALVLEEIMPVLEKKVNPFPYNQCYKPMRKNGIQGNYFADHESQGKVIGPVSTHERQDMKGGYGKNRLIGESDKRRR
jgi:hypothetical protein